MAIIIGLTLAADYFEVDVKDFGFVFGMTLAVGALLFYL